jgi:UDP:flavonoid glycosyltransferase YjiC (YdhE family)
VSAGPFRVLFFAEGATLAHVGRPLVLARALQAAGFDVRFARPPDFEWVTRGAGVATVDLACQSAQSFDRRLARGQPLYELATLQAYVEADLALIRAHAPDLVVGDFRLSLSVSARLAGVPYATLCDAYWSPEAPPQPPPLPVLPFTRFMPIPLAGMIFRAVSPLAFRLHARPMEALRRAHGLPGFGHDLRRCYTDADLRLFANPAALFPGVREHAGAAFIGALAWSVEGDLPLGFPADEQPVFVSMGSSGDPAVLRTLVEALAALDLPAVVATAGRAAAGLVPSQRVHIYPFLPMRAALAHARLVICNGGSPATNLALRAGIPVLGVARNMDQFLNMRAVVTAGAGRMLRADRLGVAGARDAIAALLADPAPRRAALALQQTIGHDAEGTSATALLTALAGHRCGESLVASG